MKFFNLSERQLSRLLSPTSNEAMLIQKAFAIFITIETVQMLSVGHISRGLVDNGMTYFAPQAQKLRTVCGRAVPASSDAMNLSL